MKGRTRLPGPRLALFCLLILLVLAAAPVALAQDKTLYWQRYDVDLTVLQSGDFRVVETQELVFTSGTFRFGQREILINRFSDITDITVREENGPEYEYSDSDAPYTYRYYQDGSYVKVRYNFPPSTDMRRTIVIGYTIVGGLRYYPDNGVDQLYLEGHPGRQPVPHPVFDDHPARARGRDVHQLRAVRRGRCGGLPGRPARRDHPGERPHLGRAGG